MSNNPKKPKLEQEFNDYNIAIENKAQEEIRKLKAKISQLKEEAEKIGSKFESEEEGHSVK